MIDPAAAILTSVRKFVRFVSGVLLFVMCAFVCYVCVDLLSLCPAFVYLLVSSNKKAHTRWADLLAKY